MSEPDIKPNGFADFVGIEWLGFDPDGARARVPIEPQHLQPYGIVHGGVLTTLSESLCSAATHVAVSDDGMAAMGQANDTTFLRPLTEGHINAAARARHRGRTTWVWDVEITDDEGRVCALSRMTIAVRPQR